MKTKEFKSVDEKLLAIVDFGRQKKFYIVDCSDIQSFLAHHSSERFACPPPIIFQTVLVYDPVAFQSQLDSLWKGESMSNPLNS